jgi:competence protein ComEA
VAASASALVNINTASAEELDTLPGIGEVLAAAILQYREEHGPFTSVDQLVDVSGIGEVTLEELRDLVTI